jgi:phosphoribosylaminoimidazole-succinocarboxamide synthase
VKFLGSGKVKDIYELDGRHLLFRFSERVSAYDVKFQESIPKKGEVLCRFAEFWFDRLPAESHFVERRSDTEIVVRRMDMLPLECVVRGYFYGSLADRFRAGRVSLVEGTDTRLAARLPEPVFDPTTKSTHDIPVTRREAVQAGLVTSSEYDWLEEASVLIYRQMAGIADDAGFILADLKLEFGRLDGRIVLGDSIGPDEYRLWLKRNHSIGSVQDAYDKQILRDWLTAAGYQERFERDRDAGRDPTAPAIPPEIVQRMTSRYIEAYERITGQSLRA